MVEEAEVVLGEVVDVARLFEKDRAEEVVEDLAQFCVALYVADVLLLDLVLDLGEVGLQFRVEVVLALHQLYYLG